MENKGVSSIIGDALISLVYAIAFFVLYFFAASFAGDYSLIAAQYGPWSKQALMCIGGVAYFYLILIAANWFIQRVRKSYVLAFVTIGLVLSAFLYDKSFYIQAIREGITISYVGMYVIDFLGLTALLLISLWCVLSNTRARKLNKATEE